MSSPTSSGGPSTNPFLSSPTAAASSTAQPIVDLFGSLPATADAPQVINLYCLYYLFMVYLMVLSGETMVC